MHQFRAIISGRVQMVMFRDFTAQHARRYGLVGTVRNCADGTVEVVAQGTQKSLDRLLIDLHKGSLLSRVEAVQVKWGAPEKQFDSFTIVY